jgi:hypothetical protein
MSPALARRAGPELLDLAAFSRMAGLHPELVVRLVRLGLLEAGGSGDALVFAPAQVARAARMQRLRAGLPLNYAALGLVLDLLDRIDALEAASRRRPTGGPNRQWT